MDFELSEEQAQLRKTVREFAESELAPHSREWDEKQGFPRDVFSRLGGLGVAGCCWPEEYGGSGLSTLDWAVVMEELARVDAGVALSLAAHHSLCSAHVHLAGSEEQKRRFLPPLARGEKVGCWGLTEPGSGSDAGGHAHDRGARRPALGPERLEELHHQRGRSPTPPWSWRSPTAPPGRRASRRSWSSAGRPASAPARRRTSSACARRTPRSSSSRTAGCRRRTSSAARGWGSSTP